ncbi:SMP-30/gluconolactonase/LRE family protein [Streptomyces sp. NPDC020681]|uniref:SMP-30/gluconolactonase/LRE family protein n=1 Tax=Streptomyces sp. NPDC020681 TaxID=3365083 RepID=UPI0037931FC2
MSAPEPEPEPEPGPEPVGCWSERFELGEGIRRFDDSIVLVDILSGRLLSAPDRKSPLRVRAQLPVPLGAVAPVAGSPGSWIAAAGTGICRIGPDGNAQWLARPEDEAPVPMRMNDATADPYGRFWAGSMAYDTTKAAGSLYRVDRDGTVSRALTGITIPNGPAFTADCSLMYLADSARGVIRSYSVDPGTGALGAPTDFAALDEGSPDGMTVDVNGGLWTAVWGAGAVHRYLPDGTLDRVVRVPAPQPAGVCLDGHTLWITSARIGLAEPGPLDGAVFTARVDVPGPPAAVYRPEKPA